VELQTSPAIQEDRFSLSIPASIEQITTARVFCSTLARHLDEGEEFVEDIKLVVSEGCSLAIDEGASGPILLEIVVTAHELLLQMEFMPSTPGERIPDSGPARAGPRLTRLDVVNGLFPGARVERLGERAVLRVSAPRTAPLGS